MYILFNILDTFVFIKLIFFKVMSYFIDQNEKHVKSIDSDQ